MRKSAMLDDRGYVDFSPIWGGNLWAVVIGGRGTGKTFACKFRGAKNYIKHGTQWVYLRRTEEELKGVLRKGTFLDDLATHKDFKDYEFRVSGTFLQMRKRVAEDDEENKKKVPWETFGFALALSTAHKLKGDTCPNVTFVEYDEFIIESDNTRYLNDEYDALFRLYSTLDRNRDVVQIVCTSNACNPVNPILAGFHIPLGTQIKEHGMYKVKCGTSHILFWFVPPNDAYMKKAQNTMGYKLRDSPDDDYNSYAFANEFTALDDNSFIADKPENAVPKYKIRYLEDVYTIYVSLKPRPIMYIDSKTCNAELPVLCVTRKDQSFDGIIMQRNDSVFRYILNAYRFGHVAFGNQVDREKFVEFLNMIGLK